MDPRFEQFIQERKYLLTVSPATLDWYKHSLNWLPTPSPSQDELKGTVLRMREDARKGPQGNRLQFCNPGH
jgi:hypothetical protein